MRIRTCILILLTLLAAEAFAQLNITPTPAESNTVKGPSFKITSQTTVFYNNPALAWNVNYLKDQLRSRFGISLRSGLRRPGAQNRNSFISIVMEPKDWQSGKGDEFYNINAVANGMIIQVQSAKGFFYAIQTILQSINKKDNELEIPAMNFSDYPRFTYRGMHLDVARHFFPVSFVKKYIDYLATYKYNTFHWHLTDDQGWRIEIRKYPLLTQVGGCRDQTLIGHYGTNKYDGTKYCGYYTQKEIREVVKYASDRNITVIPEIEMPGHALAALTSYPYLGCTKGPYKVWETWGVSEDVMCAGNDSTYVFLQNVLDEVVQLFPSKYIHIGGDECPKVRWKNCPVCQARIRSEGLKNEHELQSYLVQRIEKYLSKKGKEIIGWDEILEGGLGGKATIMSWRGEEGGIAAAKLDHDAIMCPGSNCYFDHSQSKNDDSLTFGSYLPLENVYNYEPVPTSLDAEQAKHIIGAQGNLWTEYITNPAKVEYMIFPRMIALSEVLWSPKEKRNWDEFEKRLPAIFDKLDREKISYSRAYYDLVATVIPSDSGGIDWKIKTRYNGHKGIMVEFPVNENISGRGKSSPGGADSIIVHIPKTTEAKAILAKCPWPGAADCAYDWGHPLSAVKQDFHYSLSTGKKITLVDPPAKSYPGDGAFTLVNGVWNKRGLEGSSEFLGFSEKNMDATIDLGKETDISDIKLHTFTQTASWIYPAKEVTILLSSDGINFATFGSVSNEKLNDRITTVWIFPDHKKTTARYVRVVAKNFGSIPAGNPGAGNKAWLFVDEIEVE